MGINATSVLGFIKDTKRKVFISFYHKDDEYYRKRFEELFGHLFLNKSVKDGDINTDVSAEYIKRLIQNGYISDTSVLVVLVGAKTYCRKHVDWEISAALSKKVGGYSGLIGLRLPTHPDFGKNNYKSENISSRLVENLESGYAKLYDWHENETSIKKIIDDAFNAKNTLSGSIKNSTAQFQRNRCD
jgi:hypothetical protein